MIAPKAKKKHLKPWTVQNRKCAHDTYTLPFPPTAVRETIAMIVEMLGFKRTFPEWYSCTR
jgi:hypothetical protein